MRDRRWLLGLLILGCQPSAPFELKTDRSSYSAGDTITLELESNVIEVGLYNLCMSEFVPRVARQAHACTANAAGLPGFSSVKGQIEFPRDAGAGDFQIETSVERNGRSIKVTSDTFSVLP